MFVAESAVDRHELANAIEAVLFASGEPMSLADIKRVFERVWGEEPEVDRDAKLREVRPALQELQDRWRAVGNARGFLLMEVGDGWVFRSNPRYSNILLAMRETRPQRLSKPALETLAIIAYRQPVTKPEIDHIRGVDSGGTVKLLLDRGQVRIVGKKEEPGRPLLYGTTRDFLSLFSLNKLSDLPSLRDVHELTEESRDKLREIDAFPSIEELTASAKQLRLQEEPAVGVLDEAVQNLDTTENRTRAALGAHGITLDPGVDPGVDPATSSGNLSTAVPVTDLVDAEGQPESPTA